MVKGFYPGFISSVQGIIIYRAIYFGTYETAKEFAGEKPSILLRFGIAQSVSAGSFTVAYPFRRRLMMMSGEQEKMHGVIFQEIEIYVYEDDTKSNQKKSAKDTLFLWCQRKTNRYS